MKTKSKITTENLEFANQILEKLARSKVPNVASSALEAAQKTSLPSRASGFDSITKAALFPTSEKEVPSIAEKLKLIPSQESLMDNHLSKELHSFYNKIVTMKPTEIKDLPNFLEAEEQGVDNENQNAKRAQYATQLGLNSLQRQIANNLGLLFTSDKTIKITPELLTAGLVSRLTYNLVAIGPSLAARDDMDKNGYNIVVTAFTVALVETIIGAPLEVAGAKGMLKELGIILKPQDIIHNSARIFPSALVRNALTSIAVNLVPTDSTTAEKCAAGAITGALSTPFQNACNIILQQSVPNFREAYQQTLQEFIKNPTLLYKGGSIRALAGIAGVLILSRDMAEFLRNEITELSEKIHLLPNPLGKLTSISKNDESSKDFNNPKDSLLEIVKIFESAIEKPPTTTSPIKAAIMHLTRGSSLDK